jgi:GntR family transcriptional regulator
VTKSAGSAPLHCRIAADIIRRAVAPCRDPNLPLPSEAEIRREYGVSRATARQALTELRQTGVIITVPIGGSFLAHTEPAFDIPR